jgi:hypothetical protein
MVTSLQARRRHQSFP